MSLIKPLVSSFRRHWPEYLCEAGLLGIFMVSICTGAALLESAGSPVPGLVTNPVYRRILMGLAMGATVFALIQSPWGKRSGAHINPGVTLTFWRLGRVSSADAFWYSLFQFGGAIAGVMFAGLVGGAYVSDMPVSFAPTRPGTLGPGGAWVVEFVISFLLMGAILVASNSARLMPHVGKIVGVLLAVWISLTAQISGTSLNPARSLGSAVVAGVPDALWIYFTAPPLAMLLAGEVFLRVQGAHRIHCAKLNHTNGHRCIFRCDIGKLPGHRHHGAGAAGTNAEAKAAGRK